MESNFELAGTELNASLVPDITNRTRISSLLTTGGTYSVTKDGYLYIEISNANSAAIELRLRVGTIDIFRAKYTNSADHAVTALVPVKAGMTIKALTVTNVYNEDPNGVYFVAG